MRGIYENKQIYLSSDVLNLQGKLFGVGKKSQFLSYFFVYQCSSLLFVMTCFVDY